MVYVVSRSGHKPKDNIQKSRITWEMNYWIISTKILTWSENLWRFLVPSFSNEVKVWSKINKFPDKTELKPSHLNTTYQTVPEKPHLANKCSSVSWTSLQHTQLGIQLLPNTPLLPKLHLVRRRDKSNCHEKITTFEGVNCIKAIIPQQSKKIYKFHRHQGRW